MQPIVVVDTSEVLEGRLEDVKAAFHELVQFVEANEPDAIGYWMYLNEDGSSMTIVQVHPDSASMEFHMKVAGPAFAKLKAMLRLRSMDVYGQPSEELLAQLQQKARMLGDASVTVHELHRGFSRFGAD
jgi:quinol monooxygenase YgiN